MKVIVYSTPSFEKEFLAKANQKKHDITLLSNPLSLETANFAAGKDAVIVFTNDDLSAAVIKKLKHLNIRYIATRSVGTDHIYKVAEYEKGLFFEDHQQDEVMRLLDHPNVLITPHQGFLTREALQEIALATIKNLDTWQDADGQYQREKAKVKV